MKRLLFLLIAVCSITICAMSQNRTINGQVIYGGDNEPLLGATVQAVGSRAGTSTDASGRFTLTINEKVKYINVSYVGMATKQVLAEDNVVVVLENVESSLDEIVVTAMGVKRERKALGYNAQNLNADDLNTKGTASLASAIQGKLTGVDIRQSSGAPGASSQIVIRGARSFDGNNTPLYVIDGMPIASSSDYSTGQSVTGADYPNRALDINPDDIESINVLKGQAASALYGIRASNGVIVITTKRGKLNSTKPTVTINFNMSADRLSRKFKRQTEYAQGNYFEYNDDGTVTGYNPTSSMTWGPKISDLPKDTNYGYGGAQAGAGGSAGQYYNPKWGIGGLSSWQTPQIYDNVGDYFSGGYTENASVNISQKKENINYSFGLSNSYQKGIMPGTSMTRWGGRGLVDWEINDQWKTGFSGNYSSSNVNTAPGANDGLVNVVYAAPAEYNLKGLVSPDPSAQLSFRSTNFNNPYWWAKNNEYNRSTNRFFGNAYLEFSPKLSNENLKLTFREQAGVDIYTTNNRNVQEMYNDAYTGRSQFTGNIEVMNLRNNTFNNLLTATLDAKLSDSFDLNVMLGNEINHDNMRISETDGNNFNYYGFPRLVNASQITYGEEYEAKSRTVGFFGQATLAFKNQLYLTVTGREDIVSSMPRGNRSFFYPSVSLGWVFTELEGLRNSVLSYGKLRASYAQVGQAGHYYRDFYLAPSYGSGMYTYTPVAFPLNGISSYMPYWVKYDPDLKPQNTSNFELGADLNFFKNRLRVEYTLSYQRITDQIFAVPISGSAGYQELLTNAGKMTTWSHELAINADILQGRDYDLSLGLNFTRVWNYVNELAPGVESIFLGGFVEPQVRAQAGSTYPIIYGYAFKRAENGQFLLKGGLPQATADSQKLGACSPDFTLGINLGGHYKRVSLNTTWDWSRGGKMYHGTNMTLNYFGTTKQSLPYHEGTMIAEGIDEATGLPNEVEVSKSDYYQYYNDITEAGVYDRSFLKLRDVTLTYNLPKLGNFDISLYAFARNILIWAKMPNFDPESSQSNGNMSGYFERYSIPATSSYGAGFKVTF